MDVLVVVTLFGVTVGERAYLASQRQVMEAGDTFNFLALARAFSQGELLRGEKRLPVYPLTILFGWKGLGLDPIFAAKAVSILASGGTIALLYLLGRWLGVRPLPLALMLLVLIVAPAPNSQGIRALSDSLYVFLVVAATYAFTVMPNTARAALCAGSLAALLIATRYEGLVVAPALVLASWFRLSWRRVLVAALPVLFLYAAWIPYNLYIHGTLTGGYFSEWGGKADAVGGKITDVPQKLRKIAGGIGWSRPWEHAAWALEQQDGQALPRILQSPAWWISLLALIGALWLLLTARRNAVPFLTAFFVVTALYAMWVVYDRFIAPGVPGFYVAAGAGASALFAIARVLWRSFFMRAGIGVLIVLGLLWMVREEAPALMKETRTRVFDNEGSGYSLVLAIHVLESREGLIALNYDPMALIYFGEVGVPSAPPHRAVRLGEHPEIEGKHPPVINTDADAERLRTHAVSYLLDRGEPRILQLVDRLRTNGRIASTEEIRYPRGQLPDAEREGEDITRIHTLAWNAPQS